MARMDALESLGEPAAAFRLQSRDDGLEVGLVAVPRVLGLEEEDDLGPSVRNPVVRPLNHLFVREPDALVAPAEPGVAVRGLAEHVEAPEARRRLAHPGLVRLPEPVAGLGERRRLVRACDDEDLEPGKDVDDFVEPRVGYRDLEVFVLPMLAAEEEVDRPAGRDVPRRLDCGQELSDRLGPPGVPLRDVGVEASRWRARYPRLPQSSTSCGGCGRLDCPGACASSSAQPRAGRRRCSPLPRRPCPDPEMEHGSSP
jgi:hypothetical protein